MLIHRTEPKLRAFVPPCEPLPLLAQCSMTRHKDQYDAILTRRHEGHDHRTELNLRLLEG